MQMPGGGRWTWAWGALLATLAAGAAGAAGPLEAQQPAGGIVTGRVTEQGSGTGVPEAQVFVVGTTLGARTAQDGAYTIRGVPAGAVRLRAVRIGYTEQNATATVAAGQTVTQHFALARSAVQLQEIVTTAAGGEQRRIELGNTVANVRAAEVTRTAPVQTVTDVLNSRAAGVQIATGSATGAGARVRIRGASSLNLSNEPIYIIDGVRMTSDVGSLGVSTNGPTPGRVGDINPEEIENIEVVKGPSAATLYGTDAANGVIVITTKRGAQGPARWQAWAEYGVIEDVVNRYPTNYTLAGHSPGSTAYRECTLPQVSSGNCIADSVRTLNIFEEADLTPIGGGNRNQAGLQVSGGSNQVRYFLSGEREEETGVLELPQFERARFQAEEIPIHDWVDRPNTYEKLSFRANLSSALTPKLDVSVNSGYVNVDQRFQQDANATNGLGSHLYGGRGYRESGTVSGLGTPLMGYRAWTPGYTFQEKAQQRVNRFITSGDANWRPLSWLQANAVVGFDYTSRVDDRLRRRGEGPPLNATYRLGYKENSRAGIRNFTANVATTGTWQPRRWAWLNSKTTLGAQYVNYSFEQGEAIGEDLPPGTQTAGAAATPSSSESTILNKTLGAFVEEQVAIRDRLFLTAAVRTDQNSAFGTDFQQVYYPKAAISWVLSDEEFFPEAGWLDQFRLRASYGASGRQPGPNDALRTFTATAANVGGSDLPGVVFDEIGNVELKPERTGEFETGFDARLFGNRTSFELTFYHKRTKDALIQAIVPPSFGAAASVNQNIGAVRNVGWEGLLTAQLVDRPSVGLDLTLNASTNANKVLSLGETAPQISSTWIVQEGMPLFNYHAQKISGWEDRNGDGILTYNADPALNEVFVDSVASLIGESNPKHNVSLTTGVELLGRRLRLSTLFDYRGGFYHHNLTGEFRCASRGNCPGLSNPASSFEEQAASVARRDHHSRTPAGFIEKGDFIRLREVSATYTLAEGLLGRLGGVRSLSLNLSARNVALWTDYSGIDPEAFWNVSGGANRGQDFQSLGPPSYFVARLNVGF